MVAAELPKLETLGDALADTGRQLEALTADLSASSAAAQASVAGLRAAHEERERVMARERMMKELNELESCAGDVEAALARGDYAAAVARVAPLARAIGPRLGLLYFQLFFGVFLIMT